jgi:hypothetical protein
MDKSGKKIRDLASLLNTDDPIVVAQVVDNLRDEEPFKGVVKLMASVYNSTDSAGIKKSVKEFMIDLKDGSVIPEVIDAIKENWKSETLVMLVSSCWQSGLDYSSYGPDFTDLFIISDYPVALECFTVIEESLPDISRGDREKMVLTLESNRITRDEVKDKLTGELISLLGG